MMYSAGNPGSTPTSFYSPARAVPSESHEESFVHSEPVQTQTYTGQPHEPASGTTATDRTSFAEPASQSRPESFTAPVHLSAPSHGITPLTAALWGITAAGVWLGCSSGIQAVPSLEQSCLSAALILLFIGWCGFSAAGQAGCMAALLAEGIGVGCVAAGIWAEKSELLSGQPELLLPGLLLPVTVWAAGNSIRNSVRIWNCLKKGKNPPNLKRYLLRMLTAEAACGAVLAAGLLLRRS